MNYIFRVGDMLQTKEGIKGQIMSNPYFGGDTIVISDCDKIILRYQLEDVNGIFEFSGICKSLPLIFDQIGRYDFTKKSEIEPLEHGKIIQKEGTQVKLKAENYPNSKPEIKTGICEYFERTTIDEVIDKINEIIDYLKYQ